MSASKGKVLGKAGRAALEELLEAPFSRASGLSQLDRQWILEKTSSGEAAGRMPKGHRDDTAGVRFSGWVEPGEFDGEHLPRPGEQLTPEEEAVAARVARRLTFDQVAEELHISRDAAWRRWQRAKPKLERRAKRIAEEQEG